MPPTVTGAPAPRTSSLGPDGVWEANSMRPVRPSASDATGCAKSSDGAMISAMVNTTYLTGSLMFFAGSAPLQWRSWAV